MKKVLITFTAFFLLFSCTTDLKSGEETLKEAWASLYSSSSTEVSSSSIGPPPNPTFSACDSQKYMGKNEFIRNIVTILNNSGNCGAITYEMNGNIFNSEGIPLEGYSGEQEFSVTAKSTCGDINLEKNCLVNVTILDLYQEATCNCTSADNCSGTSNLIVPSGGITVFSLKCNREVTGYYIRCRGGTDNTIANLILSSDGYTTQYTQEWGGTRVPGGSGYPVPILKEDGLWHYPARILATVTSTLDDDDFYTCDSW
jgi:hypothetical protein